ncbi:hypothetical protein B0H13DRAFT_2410061 [Mycena leptocephala]|nr:hypothetical protein B0H13DRAFT_2410061 [Mycena leptocephala]
MCFLYLAMALVNPPGYLYAAQALDTDVLRAILVVGGSLNTQALQSRTDTNRLASTITGLLTQILPRALVHYEAVLSLKQTFLEATAVAPTSGISTSPFAKAWQHFSWLANTRLEFLQSWEERLKCARMERGAGSSAVPRARVPIIVRKTVKRQTGAMGTEMCAKNCRPSDYARHFSPPLRTATRATYRLKFSQQRTEDGWGMGCGAEKSGRTDIHLMLLFEGQRFRQMVFPMRTDTSKLQNGLVRISRGIPPGKRGDEVLPEIRERVEALALREVQSSPEMEEFTQVPLFSEWTTLATLVGQRAGGLNSWKSADSFDKQFHRNERAFMNALIDADYKRLKSQISPDIISFMQAHPHSPDAYLVHFNYTHHTGVKVTVRARPAVPGLFAWHRNLRLHGVFVAFGVGPMPQYILPLRESSTTFNAALHCIAEEIPAQADESWVENKVRELIQSTEEVVEIH